MEEWCKMLSSGHDVTLALMNSAVVVTNTSPAWDQGQFKIK